MIAGFRATHPDAPTPLVIVDYLQLGGAEPTARPDPRQRVSELAYILGDAANEHNVAVLAISSVARHWEEHLRPDPEAHQTALKNNGKSALGQGDPSRFIGIGKESGEVEYSAQTALAMAQVPEGSHTVTYLGIAKNRSGPTGWVKLYFDGCRHSEQPPGQPVPKPPKGAKPDLRVVYDRDQGNQDDFYK
jgi:replicative DNA helicase